MQPDRAAAARSVLSVTPEQAEFLFGKLGTHARIAGATLRLKDSFENDRFGRKVVVEAASRRVAASAISSLIFQLCLLFKVPTPLHQSEWHYIDAKGNKQGPFAYRKMVKWGRQGDCLKEGDRVQHHGTRCWVPLWFLLAADEGKALEEGLLMSGGDISMHDAEALVAELNSQRSAGGMLQPREGGNAHLDDFPELSSDVGADVGAYGAAEPMDYELAGGSAGYAALQEGARLFVVVDTNVLMSHMASLERMLDGYVAAATEASNNGQPVVEVLLLVPWVALSELDLLKGGSRKQQAESARHALHRLRVLTRKRDTYVRLQPVAEHQRAVRDAPMMRGSRQLRNDDMILQTTLFYRDTVVQDLRAVGQRSGAFLLTNDGGLAVRAQANGVRCFTAREFPKEPEQLAQEVPAQGTAPTSLNSSPHQQPQLVSAGGAAPSLPDQPALPLPGDQGGGLQLQDPGPLPAPALPPVSPSSSAPHHPQLPHETQAPAQHQRASAAGHAQHAQAQNQQLKEQLRQLQLAAQQASAAALQQHQAEVRQHQEEQQQRQAEAAAVQEAEAVFAQQTALAAVLQQAAAAQEATLARVAAAAGLSLDQLLTTVAARAGMSLAQLIGDRQQALAGAPVGPQLAQALAVMEQLQSNPEQAVALLQAHHRVEQQRQQHAQQEQQTRLEQQARHEQQVHQAQQLAADQEQQLQRALHHLADEAAAGNPEVLAHLAANPQALALVQGPLQAAAASGLGGGSGSRGGGSDMQAGTHSHAQLHPQMQEGQGGGVPGSASLPRSSSVESMMSVMMGGPVRHTPAQRAPVQPARTLAPQSGAGAALPAGLPGGVAGGQHMDAHVARALAARQLAAAGTSAVEVLAKLCLVVEECVAPMVMYHRQQDMGDMWLALEDDQHRPPWDARATLQAIHKHDSTFTWGVLDKGIVKELPKLERFLRSAQRRGPAPEPAAVAAAVRDVVALLQQFLASSNKPRPDGANPDPASVEMFVGLGEATAAAQRGIQLCSGLLEVLEPVGSFGTCPVLPPARQHSIG